MFFGFLIMIKDDEGKQISLRQLGISARHSPCNHEEFTCSGAIPGPNHLDYSAIAYVRVLYVPMLMPSRLHCEQQGTNMLISIHQLISYYQTLELTSIFHSNRHSNLTDIIKRQ